MKQHIRQLSAISRKRERLIVGLMSGTSLDGLDVALCVCAQAGPRTRVKLLHFDTVPYDEPFRAEIRRVFARKEIDFQHLVLLNVVIAERHAAIVLECLKRWGMEPGQIDLLASHGQTVYHAPRVLHGLPQYPNATLQIGDGDHLARRTGIITVSDFRQKHLAAGGEGAPLALYGDYYLFSKPGIERFLLNIGGIANFTWLPASGDSSRAFATDTGPGNTLIDAFAREWFGIPYDEDARLAKAGNPHPALLDSLKKDPFFALPFPKTTGPEMFSKDWVLHHVQRVSSDLDRHDVLATLTLLTAETVTDAVRRVQTEPRSELYVSGGGAHNPLILRWLKERLPGMSIRPMHRLGVDGDAKEAVLFAVLANETVAGKSVEGIELGGVPVVGMGKVSFPG